MPLIAKISSISKKENNGELAIQIVSLLRWFLKKYTHYKKVSEEITYRYKPTNSSISYEAHLALNKELESLRSEAVHINPTFRLDINLFKTITTSAESIETSSNSCAVFSRPPA